MKAPSVTLLVPAGLAISCIGLIGLIAMCFVHHAEMDVIIGVLLLWAGDWIADFGRDPGVEKSNG